MFTTIEREPPGSPFWCLIECSVRMRVLTASLIVLLLSVAAVVAQESLPTQPYDDADAYRFIVFSFRTRKRIALQQTRS